MWYSYCAYLASEIRTSPIEQRDSDQLTVRRSASVQIVYRLTCAISQVRFKAKASPRPKSCARDHADSEREHESESTRAAMAARGTPAKPSV